MDRDAEMSTGSVVAGSSSSDLGRQSGDSGPSNKWNDQPTVSTMAVSPPKTARAPAKGIHRVSCLVDGCTADLSKGREYHRRHKVCELHFKTPVLMVHRQQQRFCQQCSSRFQLVEKFDEASSNATPTALPSAGTEASNLRTILVSGRADDSEIDSQNIFHVAGEGFSEETSRNLSFSWPLHGFDDWLLLITVESCSLLSFIIRVHVRRNLDPSQVKLKSDCNDAIRLLDHQSRWLPSNQR
ncbi:unnamed protein product [Musa acuminata subsp. burmannicoides]